MLDVVVALIVGLIVGVALGGVWGIAQLRAAQAEWIAWRRRR